VRTEVLKEPARKMFQGMGKENAKTRIWGIFDGSDEYKDHIVVDLKYKPE
jgi:hypothetical protein